MIEDAKKKLAKITLAAEAVVANVEKAKVLNESLRVKLVGLKEVEGKLAADKKTQVHEFYLRELGEVYWIIQESQEEDKD